MTSLGWLDGVRSVSATVADDGELDPAPLVTACRLRGIDVYFPVMRDPAPIQFAPAGPDTPFVPNRFGIPEPDVDAELLVSARELDVVFAPVWCSTPPAIERDGARVTTTGRCRSC